MILATLQRIVHQISRSKGWYENERKPLEFHMLMVSEIAEASEEVRNKKPDLYFNSHNPNEGSTDINPQFNEDQMMKIFSRINGFAKPEGEAVEIADCLIRILDYAEYKGWNMEAIINLKMKYNETRSHRHGGKAL